MDTTKVNPVMPIKSGETQMKGRGSKLRGVAANTVISYKGEIGSFSERLKEISDDRRIIVDLGPKLREPDAGLNPVKPKLEKQGGVKAPVYSDGEGAGDRVIRQVSEISSDMVADNGFDLRKAVSADNGQSDSELLRSFGYNVTATDEGSENLADVNNQSVLLQLQGVYAPVANGTNSEQTISEDVQDPGEVTETELVQGIDTENKTSFVKPSDVNSELLTRTVITEKTEDGNIPVQKGDGSENTDRIANQKDGSVKHSDRKGKPVQAAALFKGTLEELFKQGEILFGDIITFKVTDKGIFIGGEGDSTEDLANFADKDFLQKLFGVLSETLENIDKPTVSEQFRQLLITAIQKAVSDMRDPVKKEEEYQQKLIEFLMKFVDAINGKDSEDNDEDKKVALEDSDGKDKGDLLLQLIENLIEAAKESDKNSDSKKDDYTAGIYISAFEITLLNPGNPEQNTEESAETEADPTAAVEQVSNARRSVGQTYDPVHKTVENAVDVTDVNAVAAGEERATVYSKEESRYVPEQMNADSDAIFNNESVSALENQNAPVVQRERVSAVEKEGVSVVEKESIPVVGKEITSAVERENVSVVEKESIPVVEGETVTAQDIRSEGFDSVYKAVQPAEPDGKGSQRGTESSGKSTASISSANRYGHRVRNNFGEVEELQRLFGIKTSRDDKKLKEKNDVLEGTDEDGEETKTGVDEDQGAVRAIGKNTDKEAQEGLEGIDKSIIESVTLEAIKADSTAVARAYTPDENGVKQIAAQIVSEMLNNLSDGSRSIVPERTVTTLTMTLNPESLGKITMKISEEAGKISLMVTAHNKETAEILTQRMEAVQQAAKDSGTQLEKYQVVYGPEQDSRAGQQNYDGSSKNPYVRQDAEETQKDESGSQFADFLKQAV